MKSLQPIVLGSVLLILVATITLATHNPISAATPTLTSTPTSASTTLTCNALLPLIQKNLSTGCTTLDKDQVCYGNSPIKVDYVDPSNQPKFSAPGDVAPISALKSITNGPLNLESGAWGVTVFKASTSLPGTTAGQAVTFVLYGDTNLTNLTASSNATATVTNTPPPICTGTTSRVTYLRGKPIPNGAQIRALVANTDVTITGRTDDSTWVFAQAGDATGWLSASALNISCDLATVPAIKVNSVTADANLPAQLPAIHAFYFQSGVASQAVCSNIPESGLIIQSPSGQKVNFNVNGLDLTIGSTILLQAVPNGKFTITVIEGHATATLNGQQYTIYTGQSMSFAIGGTNGLQTLSLSDPPTYIRASSINLNSLCEIGKAANMPMSCAFPTAVPTKTLTPVPTATSAGCTSNCGGQAPPATSVPPTAIPDTATPMG